MLRPFAFVPAPAARARWHSTTTRMGPIGHASFADSIEKRAAQRPRGADVKPQIADLFCGAGGAGMGLHRAGFEIVGFDIVKQPRYPFAFVQQDALTVDLSGFDAVWASPPCQAYSIMRNLPWLRNKEYPRLIDPTREMMEAAGKPWIIENVMGAHLQAGWLCGTMFGLPIYRHRAFESSWFWMQPGHPRHEHTIRPARTLGGRARTITWRDGTRANGISHAPRRVYDAAKEAMGIDWMTQDELSQAIPPAYSEYLGRQLMKAL